MKWRGVLAGAYLTDKAMAKRVAHLTDDATYEPLCKRVDAGRMCDLEDDESPKCPKCLKLAAKLAVK